VDIDFAPTRVSQEANAANLKKFALLEATAAQTSPPFPVILKGFSIGFALMNPVVVQCITLP
jgi:hypothetical protein